MTEAVIDASALIFALTSRSSAAAALGERILELDTHAPHLVDAECGHSLRSLVRRGEITASQGYSALRSTRSMIDFRYDHDMALTDTAWTLRDRASFYHALYVALAARLDAPLVTGDRRLARVHDLPCRVDLVG
jgi:predicted nucleic acid-binding protein